MDIAWFFNYIEVLHLLVELKARYKTPLVLKWDEMQRKISVNLGDVCTIRWPNLHLFWCSRSPIFRL